MCVFVYVYIFMCSGKQQWSISVQKAGHLRNNNLIQKACMIHAEILLFNLHLILIMLS